ncbi:hypothetical protein [Cereibacter sediminicola]|uniref:hypothetical protein n=1 Tax=Cereibacter sediminicola TaxID=2584941 RepID=UPI00164307A8|nr:hypothetical protein [Cereibacter sediminicola]
MDSTSHLYKPVARIGKALASPKQLELIDLQTQGERSVEELADDVRIDMRPALTPTFIQRKPEPACDNYPLARREQWASSATPPLCGAGRPLR